MQDIKDVFTVLEKEGLSPKYSAQEGEYFERIIEFRIGGVKYYIEWWSNESYLTIGERYGNYIPFTSVGADDNWPAYVTGLEFKNEGLDVAYAAIKRLDWQEVAT